MTSFKDLVIDLRDTITQVFKVQIGEMESNFAFCLLYTCELVCVNDLLLYVKLFIFRLVSF